MLEEERRHAERCREGLRGMLEAARQNVIVGETVAGDRYSAERLGRHLKSLAKELSEEPDGPPFFGRLDFGPDSAEHAGRTYHIGRRHIAGPLVIDWRAPVSRAFYRASARDPMGVAVRRRFGWSGLTLTGYEDERLDRGEEDRTSSILAAEIERPRVGPMRDIVATIQPEQDDLVRADLEESLCVQGAPGTGKTAVGLHRAAYLLYAHRQRLSRSGVLVLGPNPAFLRHIAAVLPALGEVDVTQTTLEELIGVLPVRAEDSAEAAAVKHDARMARVLREALYGRIRKPVEPLVVPDGSYRWRVGEDELRRIVDDTRRDALPYAAGRERVRARVVELVRRQAEARGRHATATWLRATGRAVTPFLDAHWPRVKPEQVLYEVLSGQVRARGLTEAETRAITWARPPRSARSARWSAADLVLLDEIAGLIERPRGFGHVIVDEAQDLSPMQCRAVARRAAHGSLTVLGDLAQGTTPWAATSWPERLALMGAPEARLVELTTAFRVPSAVAGLANRLLPALGVDVPAIRAHRAGGGMRVRPVADAVHGTVAAVREALELPGSVGVIAAGARVPALEEALRPGGRLSVLPASLAKGMEFDHAVVCEPAGIAAEPRGLNLLYVALTRAVSRLDVVHALPLPRELDLDGAAGM